MCGLTRVQLTVYTGAIPDSKPDFIDGKFDNPANAEDYETMHDYFDKGN